MRHPQAIAGDPEKDEARAATNSAGPRANQPTLEILIANRESGKPGRIDAQYFSVSNPQDMALLRRYRRAMQAAGWVWCFMPESGLVHYAKQAVVDGIVTPAEWLSRRRESRRKDRRLNWRLAMRWGWQ